MLPELWNLVLAGGAGHRLAGLTGGVPKQFWSLDGERTMVEETVGRVLGLVPPARIVTVIGPRQDAFVSRLSSPRTLGRVVSQRVDRGTGIATLVGLGAILRQSDDPTVVITPADHGIGSVAEFRLGIRQAVSAVATGQRALVLFGVVPTDATPDYGWIRPSASPPRATFRAVSDFVEKPPPALAAELFTEGALWNTMVMVTRASVLTASFEASHPGLADAVIGGAAPDDAWPAIDLSRDVLARARGMAVYTWPDSIGWSDLGTPERLMRWWREMKPQGAPAVAVATAPARLSA